MNVFKEMALSVYSYGSYQQFLKNKKGKVFGFAVLLMFIYFAITMLIPGLFGANSFVGFIKEVESQIPDFQLEDNVLWVEDVVEWDGGNQYLYIDTTPGHDIEYSSELAQVFWNYQDVIIADSRKVISKNNGQWTTLKYSDLGVSFQKEDVIDWLPWVYAIVAVFQVFAYIWMTGWFFFGVLFVALIGMIIASAMNVRLTYGQLYLMGIYSRTLPLLVKALVSFLPFGIPFFWVFNFGLSALILGLAMQKMKAQMPQAPQMPMGYPPQGF